jgi:hypothetical protein
MAFSVIAVSISVSPFFTEEAATVHVHHVGPEPLTCEFERTLRTRRCFEEQIDLSVRPRRTSRFLSTCRFISAALSARSSNASMSVAMRPSQVKRWRCGK